MDFKRVLPFAFVLALASCGGGGGDSATIPTNRAPEVAFTFAPLATPQGVPVDLTITATDPDSDPLTITWKITRGTLTAQNTKKTIMRWATPATLGTDTVTVKVSDGTVTKTLVEPLKVGTVWNSPNAPTTFLKNQSPYIVTVAGAQPRLTFLESTLSTIEAGTEIYINTAGTILDVLGTLQAHGTVDQPIIIKANDRTLSCGSTNSSGRWAGLVVEQASGADSSGAADLAHVELWFAQNGIVLHDKGTAQLDNVAVRCSGTSSVTLEGSGWLRAIDSQFTDGAGDGIVIAAIASLPDSARIEGCTTSFNKGSGMRLDLDDVSQTATNIFINHNDIEFNSTHGISLAHAVFPQIHFNTFRGNGDSSISSLFLQSGYPSVQNPQTTTLDATCNYWGAASNSQAIIDIGIHDKLDQGTVYARVKSCPWLNSDPLTTTPNCSMSCP